MSDLKSMWFAARNPPADPISLSFKGKAVLVTGASSGLGLAAAIKYTRQGASPLILGVQTREQGEQARKAIMEATSCAKDNLVILTLDFASFDSVCSFSRELDAKVPYLHIAQIAGGVIKSKYDLTGDGYEESLQIGALSTALLGQLLLPKLRRTAAGLPEGEFCYLSFLNSIAHMRVTASDLPMGQSLVQRCNDGEQWDAHKQYALVKLVARLAVKGIADKCAKDAKIIVNASCPGVCKTNMYNDMSLLSRASVEVQWFFVGRTAEQGARTLVSATGLGPESRGNFWNNDELLP
ncbi:hypothetical protein JX265_002717 [Neoarthrinium moseri]|uniref:Uncharacterized protein n=1 Tax=Neoarthrinium moseri TaxID=1658444 RepID=A0A9Q0AUJ9_9PEZI|nr:hypothetical protein JX265_002717 [Neoarthrinium moseri]